jgi:hypothetical protein
LFKKGQNDQIVFCKVTQEQLDGGDDQGIGEVSYENSWRKVNTFLAEIISALTFLISLLLKLFLLTI